jgi:hypothetical protein
MSNPTEQFRLDPRLFTPKLETLAKDIGERTLAVPRVFWSEVRKKGNTAAYFPRLFDSYEQLADERIKRLYDIHCEVWRDQNRPVTPAFIRAFRDQTAIPQIRLRKSAVISEVTEPRTQRWRTPDGMALRGWSRRMDSLASRWNSKLEAKAVALEYSIAKDQQAQ